jgi:hypothetical protein
VHAEVIFEQGMFSAKPPQSKHTVGTFGITDDCEVIGNIYEHTHLLNRETTDPAAVSLGSRKSAKKAKAARIKGVKGGRPPKIHTLKKPCTFPGCKVTNGHEHMTG